MGRAVNGKPFLGARLQSGDPLADVLDQDLRPTARQRASGSDS